MIYLLIWIILGLTSWSYMILRYGLLKCDFIMFPLSIVLGPISLYIVIESEIKDYLTKFNK